MRIFLTAMVLVVVATGPIDTPRDSWSLFTGHKLKELCTDDRACLSYVAGVADTYALMGSAFDYMRKPSSRGEATSRFVRFVTEPFCVTDGATGEQLVGVVRAYLGDNPEELHALGASLVRDALDKAYPCD